MQFLILKTDFFYFSTRMYSIWLSMTSSSGIPTPEGNAVEEYDVGMLELGASGHFVCHHSEVGVVIGNGSFDQNQTWLVEDVVVQQCGTQVRETIRTG